ncbi:MAG TPA: orotate phosphoribosyltransferase [Candidatus Hydrogenedentes bacterium]|nr:orotate phosphoribosyltransferase [Candidatus Hydrogenedentota bacterium]
MLSRDELARRIFQLAHLTGEFRLRSGIVSKEYFDKYRFEADPSVLKEIAHAMKALIPPEAEVLAGLELGGIPLVTVLSQITGLPALFVRKTTKDYGTCKLAEGGDVSARNLVVVEDVVTSGGQIIASTKELRKLGARITCVPCVIVRESQAVENLRNEDLELRALFTMTELRAAAAK